MSPSLLLAVYCALVLLASLAGGWFLLVIHLTHTRLQIAISFVAGLMLGIALLHFLPDANDELHSVDKTAEWLLGGFLMMFFVQRFFHFHHHDLPEGDPEDCCGHDHSHEPAHVPAPSQDNIRADFHAHEEHAHTLADKSAKQLSWVGTTLGLTLHSLLDGLALAVAVQSGVQGNAKIAGLGVALVVILHKPFDAMAVSTLTAASGKSRKFRHVLNGLFAFASPIGAVLFYVGAGHLANGNVPVLGYALAFCAGSFLCISSSDLLPELQFHSHDRFKLSIALLAGLAVAIIIKHFES
ncbi:MAG TPA: ZIP family metal transporter [Verrucomicrobiae bacterium]|jgi:zinc and cadmium transporter